MRNRLIILGIFALVSCKAQQYPLNTDYEEVPNYSYLKDLDNELDAYVGNYKATFQGKEIILFITKQENKLEKRVNIKFYRDALIVKYIVKDPAGNILQDTKNNNLPDIELYSTRIRSYDKSVIFYYSGTNCGVGWGDVFLKKISNTQFSWEYRPDDMIITPERCPGNPDLTIYLPKTKDLIFTKQ
ncbi:DUF6705 family protein [Chryseobacterium sp.]|uniref:DUF6705 family protein n=1 Tax=Chryseobacterium sp. TaxID=1871047 RepID=UPI0024E241D8|nr:DUF6705 family protein [Chryseobacterium sp.]